MLGKILEINDNTVTIQLDIDINQQPNLIKLHIVFENGDVIDDAVVEFMTFGTPKYDGEGSISNAIVYCSGSLGTFAGITIFWFF